MDKRKPAPLAFGHVSILHAIADGNRFGFDIMDATGLTSGTVYPALDKLESLGDLRAAGETARAPPRPQAPTAAAPPRRGAPTARRAAISISPPRAPPLWPPPFSATRISNPSRLQASASNM